MAETTTTDLIFPIQIAYGSTVGPELKSTVFEATSGAEQRNSLWSRPRIKFNVGTGITTQDELDQVLALFRNVSGRVGTFRIRDWSDYQVVNETIGTGDGTTTNFQIIKKYTTGGVTDTRTITKIVANTTTVTVGSTATTAYNLDVDTGIISFTTPPAVGDAVVVNCEFDVLARFDTDFLELDLEAFKLGSADIPVREVFA